MNILPSAPTDNLYKFTAIIGVWLLVLYVIFSLSISYLDNENESYVNTEKEIESYMFSNKIIDILIDTYESDGLSKLLEVDEIPEFIPKTLFHKNGSLKTIEDLRLEQNNNTLSIEKLIEKGSTRLVNEIDYKFLKNQQFKAELIFWLGYVLAACGFVSWLFNYQFKLDKQIVLELDQKLLLNNKIKKEIELLENQINQTKKNRHQWRNSI